MKTRDERRKVLIRARMRIGAAWADTCILNMSTRGMMMQTASPPERGVYVEIRRGQHAIIARVVWTKGHRCGLRSQDPLAVDLIVNEPDRSAEAPVDAASERVPVERRSPQRPLDQRHEDSRILARAIEFGALISVAASAAFFAFDTVEQALASPLSSAARALDGG